MSTEVTGEPQPAGGHGASDRTSPVVPHGGPDGAPRPGDPPRSGHDLVDGALADLAGVAHLPPAEQIAVFEDVHQRLSATLHAIDDD